MINEFTVTPRPSNNRARHLFFILLILTVTVGALYLAVPQYKGVVGLVCLVFMVAAIYVYNRYMAIVYHYEVMIDGAGIPLFIVRHSVGKRDSTLARIELSHIAKVERLTRDEVKKHTTPEGYLRYYYAPTLDPDTVCLITVQSRYEHAEITVEASDEYINLLATYAKEAREEYYTDEE